MTLDPHGTLVLIDADPLASSRFSEALRTAVGLIAWKSNDVKLLIGASARVALVSERVAELVDSPGVLESLRFLQEEAFCFWVEQGPEKIEKEDYEIREIASGEVAGLIRGARYLLHFGDRS